MLLAVEVMNICHRYIIGIDGEGGKLDGHVISFNRN